MASPPQCRSSSTNSVGTRPNDARVEGNSDALVVAGSASWWVIASAPAASTKGPSGRGVDEASREPTSTRPGFLIIAILSPSFRGQTWLLFVVLLAIPEVRLRAGTTIATRIPRPPSLRRSLVGAGLLVAGSWIFAAVVADDTLSRVAPGLGLALVALSLVPLTGWAGQVSLCQMTFAGIGAFASVQLASRAEDGETAYVGFREGNNTPTELFLRGSVHISMGNISGGGFRVSAGNGGRVVLRAVSGGAPAIVAYLDRYPASPLPPGGEEFFYWSVMSFGMKPITRANHVVVMPVTTDGLAGFALVFCLIGLVVGAGRRLRSRAGRGIHDRYRGIGLRAHRFPARADRGVALGRGGEPRLDSHSADAR